MSCSRFQVKIVGDMLRSGRYHALEHSPTGVVCHVEAFILQNRVVGGKVPDQRVHMRLAEAHGCIVEVVRKL